MFNIVYCKSVLDFLANLIDVIEKKRYGSGAALHADKQDVSFLMIVIPQTACHEFPHDLNSMSCCCFMHISCYLQRGAALAGM